MNDTQDPTIVANPPAKPPEWTNDVLVDRYIRMRDKIAAIKKEQAAAMAPFTSALDMMGNWLLNELLSRNEESVKTKTGTFFKVLRTSCTVEEWEATLDFIIKNNAWDLLERRVSKTAVVQVMDDTQQPVPGVSITQEYVVNVRRPNN